LKYIHTHTNIQTDIQTYRHTHRQTDRQIDTGREGDKHSVYVSEDVAETERVCVYKHMLGAERDA
jgi:hypothetical protein